METNKFNNENNSWKYWILHGLVWAVFMFVIIELALPFFNEEPITWRNISIALPIWIIGGLAFGATMKALQNRRIMKG